MADLFVHESGFDAIEDPNGVTRVLALMPPQLKVMARVADVIPLIPRSEWRPTDREAEIGHRIPRYDQGSIGCCETVSEVEAIGMMRAVAGLPPVRLSFAMLYAFVNRGVDGGASIGEGYPYLQQFGVCPETLIPGGFLVRGQIPRIAYEAARNYRALKAYHCPTFDEIVTAHRSGYAVVHPVCVGGRFSELDRDGVYPVTKGMPNHAVSMLDLVALPGGDWGLKDMNHWGRRWGRDGNFVTSEACWDALTYHDAIAYESVSIDRDADLPPNSLP